VALHIAATSASITAPRLSFRGEEESPMRRLSSIAAATTTVIATLATASSAFAQDAVEWRVADGGNGHWYSVVNTGAYICWTEANSRANAAAGHLATETSSAEHDFIAGQLVARDEAWAGRWGPWIGGEFADGAWRWVTGESWRFDAWYPGEPNGFGVENRLHYVANGDGGGCGRTTTWNDWVDCVRFEPEGCDTGVYTYIVEWSADCNNDGLVDFGQIRAGELADSNANNIPDCCESSVACDNCPADIDESGTVNGVDLAALLSVWGSDGAKYPRADIDGSGEVNAADLAAVLNSWGACP
jgi:hypothetical protein